MLALSEAFSGSTSALDWLAKSGHKHLLAVYDALYNDNEEEVVPWLITHGAPELALFVRGINGDKDAIRMLVKTRNGRWAGVANAFLKDETALQWLQSQGLDAYVKLAESLRANISRNSRTSFF